MAKGGIKYYGRGGDMSFDFLCVVCKGKNKNTEAELFCSECHDYYCSSCVKCHDVIPALKNHQILDKSTAPLPAVPTERCKYHNDKPVDMYCENHSVVGCPACMLVKHSSCKDKLYIPDAIKTNSISINSDNVEEELERITKYLNIVREAFIKEKEDLKGNKFKMIKEIGTIRKKINELLDKFEKNVVQQLDHRLKSPTDKIDACLEELQATTTEIKASQDRLKSAGGNTPQKFVSIMLANLVVASAEEKVNINKSQIFHTEVSFLANKKLQTLFSEIKDLGSIRVREILRITGRQKYPVKVKSDSNTCDTVSACTLNDGTIILADKENSKLKRLDSFSYTVTDCCNVPEWPWQVCAISDKEVAVSCGYSAFIQFVKVGRTMKKTRQIKTGFLCLGLAYADERLFVSDNTSVYMFSLSGEQHKQIYNGQSVQRLFSYITALAVDNDISRIYVADFNSGFIILSINGQLVGQYNGDKLREACHVCIDNNYNVLVCGRYSSNVLQFSPDGKLIGEVLKTDRHCNTVCCDKNNSKLLVGLEMQNEIEVHDIK